MGHPQAKVGIKHRDAKSLRGLGANILEVVRIVQATSKADWVGEKSAENDTCEPTTRLATSIYCQSELPAVTI